MDYGWVAIIVAVLGSGGVAGLLSSRSTREGALIDQYQENIAEVRADLATEKAARIEDRENFNSTITVMMGHIIALHQWADEGANPPPPAIPPELWQR